MPHRQVTQERAVFEEHYHRFLILCLQNCHHIIHSTGKIDFCRKLLHLKEGEEKRISELVDVQENQVENKFF